MATERDKVERFVNGLRMSLQKDLALCELPSHAETLDKALKAEWVREHIKSDQEEGKKKRAQPDSLPDNKKETLTNKQARKNGKCERCGREHEMKDCPQTTGACF